MANHSWDHADFDKLSFEEQIQNIQRAQDEIGKLPNARKDLRFPFSHEGENQVAILRLRAWLKANGYALGWGTDTADWFYNGKLVEATEEGRLLKEKGYDDFFAESVIRNLEFGVKLSREIFNGRDIIQPLLMHFRKLTARNIGRIIDALRERGVLFVHPDEVAKDPLAQILPEGKQHLRLERLATERKFPGPTEAPYTNERFIVQELIRLGILVPQKKDVKAPQAEACCEVGGVARCLDQSRAEAPRPASEEDRQPDDRGSSDSGLSGQRRWSGRVAKRQAE